MQYNNGQHWILAVIDPWDDSVMYFNPLRNEPGDDFKDLIKLQVYFYIPNCDLTLHYSCFNCFELY